MKEPCRLTFLCERTILLNLNRIPIMKLPYNLYFSLTSSGYLDLEIHTWPCNKENEKISLLRVKRYIIVKELEWMICHKLSLSSPRMIKLYRQHMIVTLPQQSFIRYLHIDTIKDNVSVVKLPRDVAYT